MTTTSYGTDRWGTLAEDGVATFPLFVLRHAEALGLSLAEAVITGLALEFITADKGPENVWVVWSALMQKSGLDRSTVYRATKKLLAKGYFLEVAKRGRTCVYDVRPLLAAAEAIRTQCAVVVAPVVAAPIAPVTVAVTGAAALVALVAGGEDEAAENDEEAAAEAALAAHRAAKAAKLAAAKSVPAQGYDHLEPVIDAPVMPVIDDKEERTRCAAEFDAFGDDEPKLVVIAGEGVGSATWNARRDAAIVARDTEVAAATEPTSDFGELENDADIEARKPIVESPEAVAARRMKDEAEHAARQRGYGSAA